MTDDTDQVAATGGFWDHVEALRGVLLRCAVTVVVMAAVLFAVMPWIFDNIILAPCREDFPLYRWLGALSARWGGDDLDGFKVELINIRLASQFFIHMSTSLWLAVALAFPIVIHQLWGFIAPGLYENEKRGARRAFLAGNAMFYLGVATGYFLVFPLTLRFLAQYKVSEMVPNQISLDSYMDNFLVLILVMGIIFELPLVCWMLGRMGLLTRDFFTTYRRHAIVALMALAAVVTPTGDPFTHLVGFLPVYLLWERGAMLVAPRAPSNDRLTADGLPQS